MVFRKILFTSSGTSHLFCYFRCWTFPDILSCFFYYYQKRAETRTERKKQYVLKTTKETASATLCHYIRLVSRVKRSYSLFSVPKASVSGVVVQMKLSLVLQLRTFLIKWLGLTLASTDCKKYRIGKHIHHPSRLEREKEREKERKRKK